MRVLNFFFSFLRFHTKPLECTNRTGNSESGQIGLMRMGTLLVEENPQKLMIRYNCTNLEEVFLKICHLQKQPEVQIDDQNHVQDEDNNNDRMAEDENRPLVNQLNSSQSLSNQANGIFSSDAAMDNNRLKQEVLQQRLLNIYNDTTYRKQKASGWSAMVPHLKMPGTRGPNQAGFFLDHFNKAGSQIKKSIVKTQRNIGLITFQLLLPTITMIFFCLCIGNAPDSIDLAVYNEEVNVYNYSHDFINKLDDKMFNLVSFQCDIHFHLITTNLFHFSLPLPSALLHE